METQKITEGREGKLKIGMFIWPLLAALGIIGHFRLAAFGCSSSERVKEVVQNKETWIESDHVGDWSPEKGLLFLTDVSATCVEAIFRVK